MELVENLELIVDPIKRILHFCRDTGDNRSRIFKTLFMGTQNNLLCGLREIFITNMNISVKIIIAKYNHYLHSVIGCAC